jgi:hypothetical protein
VSARIFIGPSVRSELRIGPCLSLMKRPGLQTYSHGKRRLDVRILAYSAKPYFAFSMGQ